MARPNPKVELCFGAAPLTDPDSVPIAWVDVSAYVQALSTSRGRSTELDTFSAGTASITLDNTDRRFDPSYTAGPYFGTILPNVHVRITASTGEPIFRGYVDGWPQSYAYREGTVTLTCSDAFKFLARRKLPESVYFASVKDSAPFTWLRLGDADSSDQIALDASGNSHDGIFNEAPSADGLIVGSASKSVRIDQSVKAVSVSYETPSLTGPPFSIEMWVKVIEGQLDFPNFVLWMNGPSTFVNFGVDSTNALSVTFSTTYDANVYIYRAYNAVLANTTRNVTDGRAHHVVFTLSAANVPAVYVDGISSPGIWVLSSFAGSVGGTLGTRLSTSGGNVDGENYMQDYAVYDRTLSAAEVLSHYQAGTTPWSGDDSGTRLGRMLDLISWPATQRAIDTGESHLGAAVFGTSTALDYAQALANTEQGRLFIDRSGNVTLHAAGHDVTTTTSMTSQATFTDAGSGGIPYEDFSFSFDDRFVFNEVTAAREGGDQSVTVSTGDVFVQSKSVDGLLCRTDGEARNIAEGILWRYKTPKLRVEGWRSKPLGSSTYWASVLALEIGHRVTLVRKPQNVGTAISSDFLVESINHDIAPDGTWTLTFAASPADPSSYFRWGTSNWNGTAVWR